MNACLTHKILSIPSSILIYTLQGDGDPPGNARKFVKKLLTSENAGNNILSEMRYALLGLGDTNYTNFAGGPKRLERAMKKQGATSFYETAFADDGTDLEGTVEPWIEGLFEGGALEKFLRDYEKMRFLPPYSGDISPLTGMKTTPSPISDITDVNTKKYSELKTEEDEESDSSDLFIPDLLRDTTLALTNLSLPPLFPIHLQLQYEEDSSVPEYLVENAVPHSVAAGDVIYCNISEAKSLTRNDAIKHCIEMKFTSDNLFPYSPGDSFGICCQNSSSEVEWLIKR